MVRLKLWGNVPYFRVRHINKSQIKHRQDELSLKVRSRVMVIIKFERPS